jgi:hypothetical protein
MMISDDHPIFEISRPSVELEKLTLKVLFVPNSDSSDTSEQWSIEGRGEEDEFCLFLSKFRSVPEGRRRTRSMKKNSMAICYSHFSHSKEKKERALTSSMMSE